MLRCGCLAALQRGVAGGHLVHGRAEGSSPALGALSNTEQVCAVASELANVPSANLGKSPLQSKSVFFIVTVD